MGVTDEVTFPKGHWTVSPAVQNLKKTAYHMKLDMDTNYLTTRTVHHLLIREKTLKNCASKVIFLAGSPNLFNTYKLKHVCLSITFIKEATQKS